MNRFQICTAASHLLDGEAVQNFDEGTKEAEIFGNLWTWVPQAIQMEWPWNFNQAETSLAQDGVSPTDPNWLYRYTPPGANDTQGDFLQPIRCTDRAGIPVKFRYRGGKLLRNSPTLRVLYQFDLIETKWPITFCQYAIPRLAWEACEALNGEGAVRVDMERKKNEALSRACLIDRGQEGQVSEFIGRRGRWDLVRF